MPRHLLAVAAAVAALLSATCSGDSTSSTCPPIETGMNLTTVETNLGRPADSTQPYGDPDNTTGHTWQFGDDDELVVQTNANQVTAWAWHDGTETMTDLPACPLSER